jgi:DNA (cytosine-5)-methyltransferase 1
MVVGSLVEKGWQNLIDSVSKSSLFTFYEFFAGGGMVRAGLGENWNCLFANDFDHKKSRVYRDNWGDKGELKTIDVAALTLADLPGRTDLVWASFPCQDLSLAGAGAGLKGERSGTFWPFWRLIQSLAEVQRAPRLIVLENVCGALSSHEGKDFAMICSAMQECGYLVGALVIDAVLFVPQSRPRLFIIGIRKEMELPDGVIAGEPCLYWHKKALKDAYLRLPEVLQTKWIWWNLPLPSRRQITLSDILESHPSGVKWFTARETDRLVEMMSDINREKLEKAKRLGRPVVGGVYKRTRRDEYGRKTQRAEIRFDDISGCLRTPAGGSSRQVVVIVDGSKVTARLISTRETARLMGLPDTYNLPENYNEGYHLTGDGVVVPVVRHLAQHILEPILNCAKIKTSTLAA